MEDSEENMRKHRTSNQELVVRELVKPRRMRKFVL